MGKVMITYKIYPKENEIEKVKEGVLKMNPIGIKEEDVAFGIVILKAAFVVDDKEGEEKRIEEALRNIDGVSEIEVMDLTLIDGFEDRFK